MLIVLQRELGLDSRGVSATDWGSFNYADLSPGDHEVATHLLGTFSKPRFQVHIDAGKNTYIKVDGNDFGFINLTFKPVPASVAEQEMANLPLGKK